MGMIRVLIADDHTLFRRLLADMLVGHDGIEVVGQAAGGTEAVNKARRLRPDLILMDLRMPGIDGVEATRIIRSEMPATTVLMLTMSEEDQDLAAALKAGAGGYLLKNVEPADLVRTIQLIVGGHAVIHPNMVAKLFYDAGKAAKAPSSDGAVDEECVLTQREKEILGLLSQGATNRQIAHAFCITETTVKAHVHSILSKLHFSNRVQATKWAMEKGLAQPAER